MASQNSMILYTNINDINNLYSDNIDINLYLYRSNNLYKGKHQFIYLVNYYCNHIYKELYNVRIK